MPSVTDTLKITIKYNEKKLRIMGRAHVYMPDVDRGRFLSSNLGKTVREIIKGIIWCTVSGKWHLLKTVKRLLGPS